MRDVSVLDKEPFKNKEFWTVLLMDEIQIKDEINAEQDSIKIVNVPKIIKQACDENSILYSEEGVRFINCEWAEYGETIKIDTSKSSVCEVCINSGYAKDACYQIIISSDDVKPTKKLIGISINGYSSDNYYFIEGQDFNSTGLKVIAEYSDGSSKEITDYKITDGKNLKLEQTNVTITYTENGITKEVTQEILVILKGDTNGDKKIDFKDMLQINKHRLGKTQLIGIYLETADITGDEIIDFKDVLRINKYRLGKTSKV